MFVNDSALAIAQARDGISLDRHGRLVVANRAAAKRLAALQADVGRGGAGGLVHVERPSGRPPYVVLVSPLPSAGDLVSGTGRDVLFAIHDPGRRAHSTVQHIAHLLHVPLGAAKVVEAILE